MSRLRLPDFIIAGAPRCGTTWLWHALASHPEVAMAGPVQPEPKFFLRDDLFCRGLPYYSQTWFEHLPEGRVLGEKSSNYLESAVAAQRIRESLGAVKLIFVLREPVDRAYSNYLWSRGNGMETLSFQAALDAEQRREEELSDELKYARPHAYFSRGCYALMLASWVKHFARESIKCLRYEDLVDDSRRFITEVQAFLEIGQRPADGELLGRINAHASTSMPEMAADTRAWLTARYAEHNRDLGVLLGDEFQLW